MKKYLLKFVLIFLIVTIYFIILERYIIAYEKPTCQTSKLEEAIKYCGIKWYDLNEKMITTNYIHFRNARKGYFVSIHRCDPKNNKERHYITTTRPKDTRKCTDMVWYIIKKSAGGGDTQSWNIYRIKLEESNDLNTQMLRQMLEEYEKEIYGRHRKSCPYIEKKKKVNI